MRILITGASGFIGCELTDHFSKAGFDVIPLVFRNQDRLKAKKLPAAKVCDLNDLNATRAVFLDARPDAVIHMAASRAASSSWEILENNLKSSSHVLEACKNLPKETKIIMTGSSAAYGSSGVANQNPLLESEAFRPVSPYGVAKAAADLMAYQSYIENGLALFRVRPFNIIGPGQSPGFFCSDIAEKIAALNPPASASLKLSHLDSFRDFLDVQDLCRAYEAILKSGKAGEAYNVCSGKAVALGDVVQKLIGLSGKKIQLEISPATRRPNDIAYQCGSHEKLSKESGWKPLISLEDSLEKIMQHALKKHSGTSK